MKSKKSILVTGASGMLGGALLARLLELNEDFEVFALRRPSSNVSRTPAGLYELDYPRRYFDIVVHAGSPASPKFHTAPTPVFEANVSMTQLLMDLVIPGGTFVYISSGEVYGPNASSPVTEMSPISPILQGPRSYYPLAKLAGESIARSRDDVRSLILRTFHTFGPGIRRDDGRSFADMLWTAVETGVTPIRSSGNAIRSFLSDLDFCDAVLTTVQSNHAQGIFNVGSPKPKSILEFAEIVASQTGSKLQVQPPTGFQPSPIDILYPDVAKLVSLGWHPQLDLDELVARTLKWIRTQGHRPSSN